MVLNAYQTTQNCPLITNMATFFSISCTVFALQEPESQNSETITGNQVAAREKCRLIDAQKLQP